jgi:allantoicase
MLDVNGDDGWEKNSSRGDGMRLWTKIKLIFAGLVSAIAIVGAIILSGKFPRTKKTTVKSKHNTTPDTTIDNIEAKYRDK